MVVLLATGAVPPAVAGSPPVDRATARAQPDESYRAILNTVILVAGMFPLSTAMEQTGAAAKLADGLVRVVGGSGGRALLLGLLVFTVALGQLISDLATALIVIGAPRPQVTSTCRRSPS